MKVSSLYTSSIACLDHSDLKTEIPVILNIDHTKIIQTELCIGDQREVQLKLVGVFLLRGIVSSIMTNERKWTMTKTSASGNIIYTIFCVYGCSFGVMSDQQYLLSAKGSACRDAEFQNGLTPSTQTFLGHQNTMTVDGSCGLV